MEGHKAHHIMPLTDNTQSPLDDTQKAALMATHYHQKLGLPSNIQPLQDPGTFIQEAINFPRPPDLTQIYTREEFKVATHTLKTGKHQDLILFSTSFSPTSHIYNLSWLSGEFPTCWKISILIPILKLGKNPAHPLSYRPTALLSCVGKLMERMVATRLILWLE